MSKHSIQHPLFRVLPSRPRGPMRVPARALGWFSIAVGLAALTMPREGGPGHWRAEPADADARLRACCELGTGIGILTSKDPAPWLWGSGRRRRARRRCVGAGLVTQRGPCARFTSLALLAGRDPDRYEGGRGSAAEQEAIAQAPRDYSDRSGFPPG
jgi:hypothetical protein